MRPGEAVSVGNFFPSTVLGSHGMGFGSYDESEQENQEIDVSDDDGAVDADGGAHEGDVEFEIGASNDELLERLQDIKER